MVIVALFVISLSDTNQNSASDVCLSVCLYYDEADSVLRSLMSCTSLLYVCVGLCLCVYVCLSVCLYLCMYVLGRGRI